MLPTLLGTAPSSASADNFPTDKHELSVAELRQKLDAAETKIRGLVSPASVVQEVRFDLPRLAPGATAAQDLLHGQRTHADATFVALPTSQEADDLEVALRRLSPEQRMLLVSEAMDGQTTEAEVALAGFAPQLRAPLLAAVASVVLAISAGFLHIRPSLAAAVVAIVNAFGFMHLLHRRATALRNLVAEHTEILVQHLLTTLRGTCAVVARLPKRIAEAVDKVQEQQRVLVEHLQSLEVPFQVDLPDPSSLKQPLQNSAEQIAAPLKTIEEETRTQFHSILSSVFLMRIALDARLFYSLVIIFPSAVVLALNSSFALAQAASLANTQQFNQLDSSVIRGVLGLPDEPVAPVRPQIDWTEYLQPLAGQMVLLAVQVCLAVFTTQEAKACTSINALVASAEPQLSASVNSAIVVAMDDCFKEPFQQVAVECDQFFPSYAAALDKVEEADVLTSKAKKFASPPRRRGSSRGPSSSPTRRGTSS